MDVTVPDRLTTVTARLARSGFADSAAALALINDLDASDDLVDALAAAADPDLAIASLRRLVDAASDRPRLAAAVARDEGFRGRLTAVLGASAALGAHLARHPDQWHALADETAATTRPSRLGLQDSLRAAVGSSTGRASYDALRVAYRRQLLTLAARDLSGEVEVDDV